LFLPQQNRDQIYEKTRVCSRVLLQKYFGNTTTGAHRYILQDSGIVRPDLRQADDRLKHCSYRFWKCKLQLYRQRIMN